MRNLKACFLVIIFLLSNVLTANANTNLITADELAFEWVQSEVLVFNTLQKKMSGGRLYVQMNNDELKHFSKHSCSSLDGAIAKIERIDTQGEEKLQKGFQRGLNLMNSIRCSDVNQAFDAQELGSRHTEFLRSLALISTSRYVYL